jgi:hypothetical protein
LSAPICEEKILDNTFQFFMEARLEFMPSSNVELAINNAAQKRLGTTVDGTLHTHDGATVVLFLDC